MGCGSSTADHVINSIDIPAKNQMALKTPYPQQIANSPLDSMITEPQQMKVPPNIYAKGPPNAKPNGLPNPQMKGPPNSYGKHPEQIRSNTLNEYDPTMPSTNPIMVSEEHLEEYINLEKEIHAMEKNKILQQLHCHVDTLQVLIVEISKLEEDKIKIDAQIKSKNLGGKPDAKELISEIDSIDKKIPKDGKDDKKTPKDEKDDKKSSKGDKDDKKILKDDRDDKKNPKDGKDEKKIPKDNKIDVAPTSLDKQRENIAKELEAKRKKHAEIESEVSILNNLAAELLDKYLKQDELLVCIFGEGYASDEEAKLGYQLEKLEGKKERIENARKKWKEAQLLLEYACKQLAVAVKQWQDLPQVPTINLEVRYSLSEDAHNNMQLKGQNLQDMTNFGEMPHCTPQELAALEAMASNSAPGTVDERHLMALDNYSDTHKRAVCMLKWFNRVLNTTIHRDLVDVSEEVRLTSRALRKERIRAIKEKYKEKYGKSFDQDMDDMDVKGMLMGCKGDHECPIDSTKLPKMDNMEYKVKPPPAGAKPAQIMQVNGVTPLQELKEIGKQEEIHKFNQGLQVNRARVEKQLGQQLNTRRDMRAQRSPARSPARDDKKSS